MKIQLPRALATSGLILAVIGCAVTDGTRPPSLDSKDQAELLKISLNRQVYFIAPDNGNTLAGAGTYSVSEVSDSQLKLTPTTQGEAIFVKAQSEEDEKEELRWPLAMSLGDGEDSHYIVLAKPGGERLTALG